MGPSRSHLTLFFFLDQVLTQYRQNRPFCLGHAQMILRERARNQEGTGGDVDEILGIFVEIKHIFYLAVLPRWIILNTSSAFSTIVSVRPTTCTCCLPSSNTLNLALSANKSKTCRGQKLQN